MPCYFLVEDSGRHFRVGSEVRTEDEGGWVTGMATLFYWACCFLRTTDTDGIFYRSVRLSCHVKCFPSPHHHCCLYYAYYFLLWHFQHNNHTGDGDPNRLRVSWTLLYETPDPRNWRQRVYATTYRRYHCHTYIDALLSLWKWICLMMERVHYLVVQ